MAESKKRCLYEILNVSRDCSQEEIRSAYRRLALQLHPDKNPTASPAAFQELQHAYEVLSDPKERQFYDSHRSQILFSNPAASSKPSSSFFDLDLFSFFSTTAFSGFGDTGKGFFKVYGDVFGKIYAQELFFVKEMGLDEESVRPSPLIGNLESPYSQVTAFYNYWLGFCTVLDFGWMDEYDVSLRVNRRSRRAMEEENKKKRKKARREYNDLVRDLAAFVKKRDKRVKDMQMKKSLEEEKRREEEKKRKKEEERKRMERVRLYEEPEWSKIDGEEEGKLFDEIGVDEEEDGKGKKKEEFYCVVCNKKFKSDKQWKNHEQSKKHREKVAELRVSFEEEEEEGFESLDDGEAEKTEDGNATDELAEEFKEGFRLEKESVEDGKLEEDNEALDSDDEVSILEAMVSGRKSRKSSHSSRDDPVISHHENGEEESAGRDSQKGRRNRQTRRGTDAYGYAEFLREDIGSSRDGEVEVQNQEERVEVKGGEVQNQEERVEVNVEEVQSEGVNVNDSKEKPLTSFEGSSAGQKGNRAEGKKNKKQQADGRAPTKKDSSISKSSSKGKKQKASSKAPGSTCEACGESFDTRNKLFAHLGETGHAVLKSR